MSVLACNRNGCDNIMCDRYSHKYGYICDECYDEMVESGETIEDFMQSEKNPRQLNYDYENEFRRR